MDPLIVCVLDMDETLGTYDRQTFHVRPKIQTLINLLRYIKSDIILWSLGRDEYVQRIVSGSLPDICKYAKKIFGHTQCHRAYERYNYYKASEHIRIMYDCDIFLMGVDDKVSQNMDSQYDLRIQIQPYKQPNSNDKAILEVCETIINSLMKAQDLRHEPLPVSKPSDDYVENVWVY
ncbi:FCP1 homology domain-containing protein [Caerostris extrusa]|uniref:FCP1 homology domain-containing protein n=1 Tax=Caerostris extrusa TaxID=172846 RepID=A0AAV4VVX9_CAEEX|nr:FCP1 homology domain-containing protein [Caerostris extrusa]